jgi:hypothetical protein
VAYVPSCPPIRRTGNLRHETQDWLHTVLHSTAKQNKTCMYIKWCLPKSRALVEHVVKVILCGCSVTVGEDMVIQAIHPPSVSDSHCYVVWALRHGCCLRGDTRRERETEWMAIFVWRQAQKFGGKRWRQNNSGSNRRLLTSPAPLLLIIKVKYTSFKKHWETDFTSQEYWVLTICIGFYCNIEPSSNTVVP